MEIFYENRKTLFTAFCGTSAERMLKWLPAHRAVFLPNDKQRDTEMLLKAIEKYQPDTVVCFGQKPALKNKVCIETTARNGALELHTDFDCEKLKAVFEQNGVEAKISHHAGASFCNCLYFNGLNDILQNRRSIRLVFIHVPFEKNITDFDAFCKKVFYALEAF